MRELIDIWRLTNDGRRFALYENTESANGATVTTRNIQLKLQEGI